MKSFTYVITDKEGIHARPAGLVVAEAKKYASSISIENKGKKADLKRIFGVMSLCVKCGERSSSPPKARTKKPPPPGSRKSSRKTSDMTSHKGSRVFEGYALGKIAVYSTVKVEKAAGLGQEKEFARFEKARAETIAALDRSYMETLSKLGEAEAALFATHKLMAEDLDFEDAIRAELEGDVSAEYAVHAAGASLAEMFASMDDAYMKERANDIREVAARIVSALRKEENGFELKEPSIILCEDLPSSELMKLDKKMILGIVFAKGGSNSTSPSSPVCLRSPPSAGSRASR